MSARTKPPELADLPEFLTTAEAAEVLRTDDEYVSRQCKAGHIKATNLGGRAGWRIPRNSLTAFIAKQGDAPPAQPRPERKRRRAR